MIMMCQALEEFQEKHHIKLDKVTQVPLEGEGTIIKRVDRCVTYFLGAIALSASYAR